MLSQARIQELANRKGVKKIAVENFLHTLSASVTHQSTILNMHADAASYRWNAVTINAIKQGIAEFFK